MNKRVVGNGHSNGAGEPKNKRRQITAQPALAGFNSSMFKPGTLVFEDGDRFEGFSFGADLAKSGEIVFQYRYGRVSRVPDGSKLSQTDFGSHLSLGG